ncbi:MAG: hypothetical protein ACC682_15095 [Gemmatimonadota bacterium]
MSSDRGVERGRPLPSALALGLACVACAGTAARLAGQSSWTELTGYYLGVASYGTEGTFNEQSGSSLQRLRIMTSPGVGPLTFDLAYEHSLQMNSSGLSRSFLGLGVTGTTGDWAPLQGTIAESDQVRWRHRLDRLSVALELGPSIEFTVGRQPVSWATTLFLTPGDPFVPFNPEDPFRDYRAGVDAARLRAFLGPFTEVDLVLRPATFDDVTTVSALGRIRSVVGGVDVGAWLGALHDEPAASASVAAPVAGAVARGEFVLRRIEDETRFRAAIGLDRSFAIGEKDLYVVAEYQYDGLGAAGAQDFASVILSEPARRGELLVLGRHSAAFQLSAQVHPLVSIDGLALANLGDPSVLLGPGLSYSVGSETSLRSGLFMTAGAGVTEEGLPGSEYGSVPFVAYVSLTTFF